MVKKEVQNSEQSTRSTTLYLICFRLLKQGKSPSQICKQLNIKKQKLNYYLTTLKQQGYIKKIGYGVWEILKDYDPKEVKKSTQVTKNTTHEICTSYNPNTTRGHAFMFHLKLPSNLKNWNRRSELLERSGISFKPLGNLGGGQRIIFKGRNIHLKSKALIIYDRSSYFSDLASETKSTAIYEFISLIESLERHLGANFKIKGKHVFKVSREHYGLVKNIMAKQYNKEGKKLMIENLHGVWLGIDNSFNIDEIEVFKNRHPEQEKAVINSEGLKGYFNSHEKTDFKVTPEFILNTMNGIQQNQLIFDKNMKSHLEVLNKIGNAIERFDKTVSGEKETRMSKTNNSQKRLSEFL